MYLCTLVTRQNKASRWNMLTLFSVVFLIWCFLSTREATYARSVIPISFPTLKRRRPEKNKYVIYPARSVRMGKKLCPWSWVRPSASGRTQYLGHSFFPYGPPARWITYIYYMASSVSGQDEPNRALWLATRAGMMELSCSLGTTHHVPREKFIRNPNINPLVTKHFSVKMAGYWSSSFLWVYGPQLRLGP